MDIILKKAVKDFRKLSWRSYLIVGVIILSLGGGFGLYYQLIASLPMLNRYFDKANHADYTYQLTDDTWINQSQLDSLDDIDEIKAYTGRLFWKSSLQLPNQKDIKSLLLVGLDYNVSDSKMPEVYKYYIKSGKIFDPNDDNLSIIIDKTFAEKNGLDVGDEIEIDGFNNAKLKIFGLCEAPEFLFMTSNPEYPVFIEGSLGIIYLWKDTLKNYIIQYFTAINYTELINYYKSVDYNNIAVIFKGDINNGHNAVKGYLKDININIKKSESFEDTVSLFKSKMSVGDKTVMFLLILTFIMGVLIVYIIFNRYVFSQKQQIGILLGLGYKKKGIMKYFIFIILLISILAIPAGIAVGFGFGYLMLYATPFSEIASFIFIPKALYLGIIGGLLIVFLSTLLPVRKIIKKVIAELIYGQTEVTRKIKKIKETEKQKSITNKYMFRNLFRNKKRTIFTVIAVVSSLLIVSASQSFSETIYYNVNRTFKYNEAWDLNIIFQSSINLSNPNNTVEDIKELDGVKDVENYTKGFIIAEGEEDQNLIMLGIDLNNSKIHYFTWEDNGGKNSAPEDDDEIVISSVHALKLGKNLGDNISLINAEGEKSEFKIVGIHYELVMTAYITLEAGQKLFYNTTNNIDGLYIILEDGADKNEIIDDIYNMGNVEVIFDIDDMYKEMMKFFKKIFGMMAQVLSSYALLISFFVIFHNSVMNIYDKNYEYGILRSLGYSKKSIFKIILTETCLLGLLPIIFAIILTFPLTEQITIIMAETFPVQPIVRIPTILIITILPIILYVIGSFVGYRSVYKQNLYEQVQTRFVG